MGLYLDLTSYSQILAYHIIPSQSYTTSDVPPWQSKQSIGGLNLTTLDAHYNPTGSPPLSFYTIARPSASGTNDYQGFAVGLTNPKSVAWVIKANIPAGNAVIHIIDRVIYPTFNFTSQQQSNQALN